MPRSRVMHTAFKGALQVALTVPQGYGTVKVRSVAYPQDTCAFEVGDWPHPPVAVRVPSIPGPTSNAEASKPHIPLALLRTCVLRR